MTSEEETLLNAFMATKKHESKTEIKASIAANILADGNCGPWQLIGIDRQVATVDDLCVGVYWKATIGRSGGGKFNAVGMNPVQAIDRALLRGAMSGNPSLN